MRSLLIIFCLSIAAIVASPSDVQAQCPMCKVSMESNLKNGGTAGQGLNKGILYLFTLPYLIVGGIGYYWYKNRKTLPMEEPESLN